jgi:hypothetical protein
MMTSTKATGPFAVLEAAFKIIGQGGATGRGTARFSGCLLRAGSGHDMGVLRSAL